MPKSYGFIVAAYALTWVALLAYTARLVALRREATRRRDAVSSDLR
jgi:hypothetical protein